MAAGGVEVRAATESDLAAVAAHYGRHGAAPWDPFTDPERLRRIPLDGLLVAEKDGRYAGFLYWFEGHHPWFDRGADRYAEIAELHVREEFQGWGIAGRLVERCLREVRARGISLAYVRADETDSAAQHLYREAGFAPFLRTLHYRQYL